MLIRILNYFLNRYSNPIKTYGEQLKLVSIRGRFAYGAVCFELLLQKYSLASHPLVTKVLGKLWQFTSSDRLDIWDEEVKYFLPEFVLNFSESQYGEQRTLTIKEFEELKRIYSNNPKVILEAIEELIEVGGCNLYGGTGKYSRCSCERVCDLIGLVRAERIELPDIEPFTKFKFTESGGWGHKFFRENI